MTGIARRHKARGEWSRRRTSARHEWFIGKRFVWPHAVIGLLNDVEHALQELRIRWRGLGDLRFAHAMQPLVRPIASELASVMC